MVDRSEITGRWIKTPKKLKNDFDPKKINRRDAYWIGFLLADGSISDKNDLSVCMSNKSLDHNKKCASYISDDISVNEYKDKNIFRITHDKLAKNLNYYGIVPRKSKNKTKIPKECLLYSRDFIRGYFDGDGWFSIRYQYNKKYKKYYIDYCWGICSYHKEILEQINEILPTKGTISKKSSQHLYELRITKRQSIKRIFEFLYKDSKKNFRMESKYNKFLEFIKNEEQNIRQVQTIPQSVQDCKS